MKILEIVKQRWDFLRILRLVMGVTVIGQAFVIHEWLPGIGGAMLTTMAILNIGCCGVQGCTVAPKKETVIDSMDDTRFEEIKAT